LVGDTDGDGVMSIYDAFLLARVLNSVHPDRKWNLKAHRNHEGDIDICEAIILAANFGKGE